ncbi:MAG: amidase [Rhizobiales bacterium]|nr:amidase [Hyphomicrobiales bacterium]
MPHPSSYASLAARFASGDAAPSTELKERLVRLDSVEPRIGAFVHIARDAAIAAAAESDARWCSGQPLSPIDGMPIGIKDIIETEDMPTGQGSPLWAGFETRRDSASVQALRDAGCIILGKTVTTEYAASEPLMPARNPHDPARTAGGSSAGSAAAVGAGILPAALGSQVVGSTLRPASYCGCVGYKPTYGALNRGGSFDHLTQSCVGVLAATPDDAWAVAMAIASRVGGDPGYPGLDGPLTIPPAIAPRRLAFLETAGWPKASEGARAAMAGARKRLAELGITVVSRGDSPAIETFERTIAEAGPVTFQIGDWEWRWPLGSYARRDGLSEPLRRRLASGMAMTAADYRRALRRRQEIRDEYAQAATSFDGFVLLGATGAAPVGLSWTGDPAINVPASLLGTPAISLPLLSDEGMPLGLQIIGRSDQDAALMAIADWVWHHYASDH